VNKTPYRERERKEGEKGISQGGGKSALRNESIHSSCRRRVFVVAEKEDPQRRREGLKGVEWEEKILNLTESKRKQSVPAKNEPQRRKKSDLFSFFPFPLFLLDHPLPRTRRQARSPDTVMA